MLTHKWTAVFTIALGLFVMTSLGQAQNITRKVVENQSADQAETSIAINPANPSEIRRK